MKRVLRTLKNFRRAGRGKGIKGLGWGESEWEGDREKEKGSKREIIEGKASTSSSVVIIFLLSSDDEGDRKERREDAFSCLQSVWQRAEKNGRG